MDEARGNLGVPQSDLTKLSELKQTIRERTNIHPKFGEESEPLVSHKEAIEKAFDSALIAITEKLDVHNITVNIVSKDLGPGHTLRELVNGFAWSRDTVDIFVNPSHPDIDTLLEKAMKRYLGHELHHAKRYEGPGFGTTFFDSLIFEGIAQHFERELVETDPEEYRYGISPEKLQGLMLKAEELYDSPSYSLDDHEKWFRSGSEEEDIPVAAGYAIGYQIVANYLERHKHDQPPVTASSLVLAPAKQLREEVHKSVETETDK